MWEERVPFLRTPGIPKNFPIQSLIVMYLNYVKVRGPRF